MRAVGRPKAERVLVRRSSSEGVVSRDDAVPLYHQIYLSLRDDILSGRLPFGASLPTEAEISKAMRVSRITARRALNELAAHRLVERRRRTGTTVVFQTPTAPIEGSIDQAVESLIAFGRDTRVSVLEIVRVAASADVAFRLQIEPSAPVVRAVRIRFLDGEPLGEVVSFAPARFGRLMTRARLAKQPLLDILSAAGHRPSDASQVVTAMQADATLAATLEIEPRSAVLRIERVVFDASGAPMLFTIARYRGDRYRIRLDLRGRRRS